MNMSSAFEHSISMLHDHQRRQSPSACKPKVSYNLNAAGTCKKKQPSIEEDIVQTCLKELQHKVELQQQQQLEFIAKTEERLATLEQGMKAGLKVIVSESPTIKKTVQHSEPFESPSCNCAAATAFLTSSTEELSQKFAQLQIDVADLSLILLDIAQEGGVPGSSDRTLSHRRQYNEISQRNAVQLQTKVSPSPIKQRATSMSPAATPMDNPHFAVNRTASIPPSAQTDSMIATNQGMRFTCGSPTGIHRRTLQCAANDFRSVTLKMPRDATTNTGAPHQVPLR